MSPTTSPCIFPRTRRTRQRENGFLQTRYSTRVSAPNNNNNNNNDSSSTLSGHSPSPIIPYLLAHALDDPQCKRTDVPMQHVSADIRNLRQLRAARKLQAHQVLQRNMSRAAALRRAPSLPMCALLRALLNPDPTEEALQDLPPLPCRKSGSSTRTRTRTSTVTGTVTVTVVVVIYISLFFHAVCHGCSLRPGVETHIQHDTVCRRYAAR
ncbi:hypothetical protein K504DRAFT_460888 [Pleomassaria siparia CBS 279.74]|uniref:Uncharacterized protein n=1 Tax=Pleomassaria siparia CBS 279.74 TaxID=1314801 RepID=A0A6G1JXX6_9PLEO|nr:hypothetical protein K504DRAFT_460888 [Pleomassaria siparia CBS 279.74]